jgi:diadenosine tetraphosphate (Ap4A) HIT family hydrolase
MDKQCDICNFLKNAKHQLLLTERWAVELGNNQAYLGRAFLQLRAHKGSLHELDKQDWNEFQEIVHTLETAYKSAFGAEPLNWGCYMNGAFRARPHNPHVHWHVLPRYEIAPTIAGITFEDPVYGELFDGSAEKLVSDEVVDQIVAQLRAVIN